MTETIETEKRLREESLNKMATITKDEYSLEEKR